MRRALLALAAASVVGCAQASSRSATREEPAWREGTVNVVGGRLWYRVVGSGPRTPLLVVHGCCGVGSYYLKPLEALADERPVVFYDQLDNGRSDHPNDTTNWRMERFVDEIVRVRQALGLSEVHLYGHSWGANVVTDYVLTKPAGVKSLTLAGAQLDMRRAPADMAALLKLLPDSTRAAIVNNEQAGTLTSPQYVDAVFQFLREFHVRRLPISEDVDSSIAHVNAPMQGYIYGKGLLGQSGWMKGYDRSSRLGEIDVPTLFTRGQFDYTSIVSTLSYHDRVKGARLKTVMFSGHLMMHDDPEGHVATLREFLRSAESVSGITR